MRKLLFVALVLSVSFLVAGEASACPMCSETVSQTSSLIADGFYKSILSIFFLPFALVSGISAIVFKSWFDKTHPTLNVSLMRAIRIARQERKARKVTF